MSEYRYEIEPRSAEIGGGWRLRLLEDGEEVGGGVFPDDEYQEVVDIGEDWLSSKDIVRT